MSTPGSANAQASSAAPTSSGISLIGFDWGSTHLRAYAFDHDGKVQSRRHSDAGALTLAGDAAFEAAVAQIAGDWIAQNPDAGLIACGMVGAKTGWREAPYLDCGADLATIASRVIRVGLSTSQSLAIIPGMKSSEPDVMRGEETQLLGAGVDDGIVVLPGTHSKWVRIKQQRVDRFATFLTGELNALIRAQSSVGKAFPIAPELTNGEAFDRGVARARTEAGAWLHELFVMRAAVVTGQQTAADASTMFAGWLLGCEFTAALGMFAETREIHLIASAALEPWFARTAQAFGLGCNVLDGEAATARGLWSVAQRAG